MLYKQGKKDWNNFELQLLNTAYPYKAIAKAVAESIIEGSLITYLAWTDRMMMMRMMMMMGFGVSGSIHSHDAIHWGRLTVML